ncbi:phosphotransferase family protein [Paenibacillus sp. OV219]|uniref:phosphotransferase family protein n=1 Tax=Paenibacillus sp. OV219 TaxID=1884377 RepID=UPI0008BA52FE|nr:phosphotransferase [Paenibacillus sp. OV219]SEN98609.1 Phosphotransferase enzyme family protein [Paenibacillus sp. OV219]
MYRHPSFDLLLHDDDELTKLLDSSVLERATIHEWPLSCVQRVRTASGNSYIYKVQAPPTIEASFYNQARSKLLVSVREIEAEGSMSAMIMEDVNAPRLNDIELEQTEIPGIAAELLKQIGEIEGDLPIFLDISTEEHWTAYTEMVFDDMRFLIHEGSFKQVDLELVSSLSDWSKGSTIMNALHTQVGYVHGDLKADNVLVTPDGYRVLDWQRPIRGPVLLDTATLLLSLGIDPTQHVPIGIVQLHHFLHLAWFAQAARRWVPQGKGWFDGIIKGMSAEIARLEHQ